ncbi:MAG: hypothetical protein ACLTPG_04895 [Mediterraneibacter gnavus]
MTPSGKLTDTIAEKLSDYPVADHFGSKTENIYAEDIYVGYRYFETFAPEKVMYEFGFGLSYTEFSMETVKAESTGKWKRCKDRTQYPCEKYRGSSRKRGCTGLCVRPTGTAWKTGKGIVRICKDKTACSGRGGST